jgi:hypothetical protein
MSRVSKYADKKPRPNCRVTDCNQVADALAVRHGVLGWYCSGHHERQK